MTATHRDRSRARARTRKAILDAAISVLGREPKAAISEIAAAAGTARSTVHRHFPERGDLVAALRSHADEEVARAATDARLDDGPAATALLRLCERYFELGDLVMVAYADVTQAEELEGAGGTDPALARTVARGHADGSIDPAMSPHWVQQTLWSTLYAAWLMARAGKASRHEALTLYLRAFAKMLAVKPPGTS